MPLHRFFSPPRLAPFALALGLAWLARPAAGGPLDADDRAKVAQIEARIDQQNGQASDVKALTDGLNEIGEHEREHRTFLAQYNRAVLATDLEAWLLESCAVPCAKHPVAPAGAGQPRSRCYGCVPVSLLLNQADGGYLEDAVDLAGRRVQLLAEGGRIADPDPLLALVDGARAAMAAGENERSLSLACEAVGRMACAKPAKNASSAAAAGRTR